MYTVLVLDYKLKLNTVSQSTSHKPNYISISAFPVKSKECDFNPSTLKKLNPKSDLNPSTPKKLKNSNCWQSVQQHLDNISHEGTIFT